MKIKTPIWKYVKYENGEENISLIKVGKNCGLKLILSSVFYEKNKDIFFKIKENSNNSIVFKCKNNHINKNYEIIFEELGVYEYGFVKIHIINKTDKELKLYLEAFQYFENDDILKEILRFESETYY